MHFRNHGYDTVRIGKMYHGLWEHDASWMRVIPEIHDRSVVGPKRSAIRPRKPATGSLVAIQTERFRLNRRVEDGFLELYDHRTDPGEFTNVAKEPEYKETVTDLSRLLDAGWKACVPD
jgi:arylsulfatase A-like enzyme